MGSVNIVSELCAVTEAVNIVSELRAAIEVKSELCPGDAVDEYVGIVSFTLLEADPGFIGSGRCATATSAPVCALPDCQDDEKKENLGKKGFETC